MTLNYGWYDVK